MAKETAKVSEEVLKSITDNRDIMNDAVLNIGNIVVQIGKLQKEIEKLEAAKKTIEEKFNTSEQIFNDILKGLEKDYPNGELDLNEGIIIYEK